MIVDEDKDIGLDAFLAETRAMLDRFEKNWRAHNAAEPDMWPMTMWRGDWFEQLIAFDASVENPGDPS